MELEQVQQRLVDRGQQDFVPHMAWLVVPPSQEEMLEMFPDCVGSQILLEDDFAFDGFSARGWYTCNRKAGNSHRFTEMVVFQQAARGTTDDSFFAGFGTLDTQFRTEKELESLISHAATHGYKPSVNDVYMPNLARFRGDPEAFVSRAEGRAKIKKVCESRGWACEGAVNVASQERGPAERVSLAEDIVVEKMAEELKKKPGMSKKERSELRSKVIDKHSMK